MSTTRNSRTAFASVIITIAIFAGASAQAATVGIFNPLLGNATFIQKVTDEGNTINVAPAYLTDSYLSGQDIFITGLLANFPDGVRPTNYVAEASELSAVDSWINNGGTFIVTGEHGNFKDTYNSWLNYFGITLDGVGYNYNDAVGFITDPTDPYLANGVSGSNFPVDNRGWYSDTPAGTDVLAVGSDGNPFAIKISIGSGFLIAIADTYFMSNRALEFGQTNAGVQLMLNAIDLAGANNGGGMPSQVPLPGAFLFMGSALGLAGLKRLRNR